VAQCLLYSLTAGLFLWRVVKGARLQLGLALALAVEPCSGKLACTVMTETLFLSLLLLAFMALPQLQETTRKRWIFAAAWLGMMLGLAYMTRYAAPVFLVAVVGGMLLQRLPWKRIGLAAIVMVLTFQLELVPLRLYYYSNFGTLHLNAFSSLSLWNSAAHLYPGSKVQTQPETEFEQYLQGFPAAAFGISETWHTNQMFHDSLAFQRFVKERTLGTAEILAVARSAGTTGWKLLLSAPGRHVQDFVLPNIARPFHVRDRIYSNLLRFFTDVRVAFGKKFVHDYKPELWWVTFGLLVAATIVQIGYRKRLPAITGFLIVSCWLYLAGIAGLTVIFLRFVYLIAPLIWLTVWIQVGTLFRRDSKAPLTAT
jgi:hypothetical protein